MRFRTADEIRDSFNQLRAQCDPRGHHLIDELENKCLVDNSLLALQHRVDQLQHQIMAGTLGDPPDNVVELHRHSVHAGEAS